MATPLIALAALLAAGFGAVGGIGGAILLVPVLVLAGVPPSEAAPLGLVTVAAGSLAAAPRQLAARSVNHRLGVTAELAASAGAVGGALASGLLSERALTVVLGAAAIAAAVAGGVRRGLRNPPDPNLTEADVGERPGTLDGVYRFGTHIVPYHPTRLGLGLGAMTAAGAVAGLSGASGGFVKTPALTEVMRVPVKVAAATTTFTIGITSAAALGVFAVQGRLDVDAAAPVALASLAGGWLGAHLQSHLHPPVVRRLLSILLVGAGVVLLAVVRP